MDPREKGWATRDGTVKDSGTGSREVVFLVSRLGDVPPLPSEKVSRNDQKFMIKIMNGYRSCFKWRWIILF